MRTGRPWVLAVPPGRRRGGSWPAGREGSWRVRTSGGDRLGVAGRAGQFEKRVGVCRIGAGGARGARARRRASRGRRRERRRRWRGRVASGATSAARRHRRQPCLLAPLPEEASPEPAVTPGCARRSGRLSPPRCCPLLRPAPAPAPDPAVSKSGREGRGRRPGFFLPFSLLPFSVSSVSSSAPHRLPALAWVLGAGPFFFFLAGGGGGVAA